MNTIVSVSDTMAGGGDTMTCCRGENVTYMYTIDCGRCAIVTCMNTIVCVSDTMAGGGDTMTCCRGAIASRRAAKVSYLDTKGNGRYAKDVCIGAMVCVGGVEVTIIVWYGIN